MCRSRGGGGGSGAGGLDPPPLKNHKNIGFSSNIGLDPLKITKLPSQHTMLGHHRHASETPNGVSVFLAFRWQTDDGHTYHVNGNTLI